MSYIERFKLKHLGWFTVEEVRELLKATKQNPKNPILSGLYAFAVSSERPPAHLCPWEVEEVVDIGKGGGGESVRVDYKNGANKPPALMSALWDRVRSHITQFIPKTSKAKVSPEIEEVRRRLREPHNKLWIAILHWETPDVDSTKLNIVKNLSCELYLCESEAIFFYKERWGKPPINNPGHNDKNKRTKRIQQKKKKSLSENWFTQNTLIKFIQ